MNKIEEILENLKSKGFVNSDLIIIIVNRDKVIVYVKLVDRTITEYKSIQELTTTLKEVESYIQFTRDLHNHRELDDENYKELMEFSKPINSSINYISKEKEMIMSVNASL